MTTIILYIIISSIIGALIGTMFTEDSLTGKCVCACVALFMAIIGVVLLFFFGVGFD